MDELTLAHRELAEHGTGIARENLRKFCWALGFNPNTVSKIEITPKGIEISYFLLQNGRKYLENGIVAQRRKLIPVVD